jgi:hypothetical protein
MTGAHLELSMQFDLHLTLLDAADHASKQRKDIDWDQGTIFHLRQSGDELPKGALID